METSPLPPERRRHRRALKLADPRRDLLVDDWRLGIDAIRKGG